MTSVPALAVVVLIVAPFALLCWLALTWPGEAAESALWRLGDAAFAAGDHTAAARCRRVGESFGVCRGRQRLFDASAVLAFAPRRRSMDLPDPARVGDLDRRLAAIWCRATPALALWSATVAARCALRSPTSVLSPAKWSRATRDRLTMVFLAHEATVVAHEAAFAAADSRLDEIELELDARSR